MMPKQQQHGKQIYFQVETFRISRSALYIDLHIYFHLAGGLIRCARLCLCYTLLRFCNFAFPFPVKSAIKNVKQIRESRPRPAGCFWSWTCSLKAPITFRSRINNANIICTSFIMGLPRYLSNK